MSGNVGKQSVDASISALAEIIHLGSRSSGDKEQVAVIVGSISKLLGVDVCSLYRLLPEGELELVASHGLSSGVNQRIPAQRGLVGLVVRQNECINVINPADHPDYYYLPGSEEEHYRSFCGVPVIYRARVLGVLVVQRRAASVLDETGRALLSTLAIHLGLLLASMPAPGLTNNGQRLTGVSGARGVGLGLAHIVGGLSLMQVAEEACTDVEREQEEWQIIKQRAIDDIQQERILVANEMGESLAAVLDAYRQILQDPALEKLVLEEIQSGKSLPWSLRVAVTTLADGFLAMQDDYLRARSEDILQLGEKLYRQWKGSYAVEAEIDGTVVLAGEQIGISDIVRVPRSRLAGIVSFGGAALSHVAIFANALGVPAVMAVGDARISEGDLLYVDGDIGEVTVNPAGSLLDAYREVIINRQRFDQQLLSQNGEPAQTADGVAIELLVNSGLEADLSPGLQSGAQGVGLYRSEIPFMLSGSLPTEEDQYRVYRQVVDAYAPRPVYIRTLDIGGDKPLPYLPYTAEENPALGWRGIRFTLDNSTLFTTQLRAILRAASGQRNVKLMIPMISSTHELDQCVALLNEVCHRLQEEGLPFARPPLGIMVEVPGVTALLPLWADRLDFISIGSNDLSQYLLALDRNNPMVGKLYDPLHPSIIHEIYRIVKVANDVNLPVSLCGQLASDPIAVMLLVGMGIRRLSMSPSTVPYIKWVLRSCTLQQLDSLLQQALAMDDGSKIRQLGEQFAMSLGLDVLR